MDKKLNLFEGNDITDKGSISTNRTDIIIKDDDTGEVVFRGSNKVILAGSEFTARKHFDISGDDTTPTYNSILALDNSVSETPAELTRVVLFAVGIDGCGQENSQVFDVDYSKIISAENLVPFRYVTENNDLSDIERNKYFGRKSIESGNIAYYFKAFETDPVLVKQYTDGTAIDENVYSSEKEDDIEVYVELSLKLNKEDCRDFFATTSSINDAKVNTVSLLTGWAKVIDGETYYQDIRPLTKLNFPNEPLIDLTKALNITYHIYY